MKSYPLPSNESERLSALAKYQILDTPPEQQFDDLTLLASQICRVPIALISLIDKDRQWFKSNVGFSGSETTRDISFCTHAICESKMTVIPDAQEHDLFKTHPLVMGDPGIRFYAGAPLTTSDGYNLGTLCVVDFERREMSEDQLKALAALSRTVIAHLESRKTRMLYAQQAGFLNAVMTELPVSVSYMDSDLRYQYANAAYKSRLGLSDRGFLGEKIIDVVGAEKFAIGEANLKRALTGERIEFEAEVPMLVDGGTKIRNIRANYVPDFNALGVVCGVFTILTDLTSQITAEKELSRKEREHQEVLDAIPVAISRWSKDLTNTVVNKHYAQYFKKSPGAIKGKFLKDLIGEEVFARNQIAIDEVLKGKPQSLEETFNLPEGKKHTLVNLLPDFKGGEIMGYYAILNDISQVKALNEEKKRLELQIIASAKMAELGEMAGGLAHEINTPLGVILGTAEHLGEMLQDASVDTKECQGMVATIEQTTYRIAKIIKGLKAFSRNADGDEKLKTSVQAIINSTLELCQERFKNQKVALTVSVPQDAFVYCRSVQVSQILLNLLSNAFDAAMSLEEKWVALELKVEVEKVIILVSDSGNGIAPEIVDKIMQPFFTTKETGKGTGLGLSVSYGLAKENDGELEVVREAKHTTFSLTLRRMVS